MDGAKVTTFVTNNGDGTADVKAIMVGNNGKTYEQNYKGINNVDPNNFYFHFTIEKAHLEFDAVTGDENNTGAFWSAHSPAHKVEANHTFVTRFTNYTAGGDNWNNFLVVLATADGTTVLTTSVGALVMMQASEQLKKAVTGPSGLVLWMVHR